VFYASQNQVVWIAVTTEWLEYREWRRFNFLWCRELVLRIRVWWRWTKRIIFLSSEEDSPHPSPSKET